MNPQWNERATEIKQRIANDPEFRAKVENDPVGALTEAGLPEGTLRAFLQEVDIEADVSGYDYVHKPFEGGLPI